METTVAERGQIVIPKAARDLLGIAAGMRVTITVESGRLVISKKVDDAISRARGLLALPPQTSVDSIMRELRGRAPSDPVDTWDGAPATRVKAGTRKVKALA